MNTYIVMLLEPAEKDLDEIYTYLYKNAHAEIADEKLQILKKACLSLRENPERGSKPRELEYVPTIYGFRQIVSKPYRIFYRISGVNVFVFGIIHGQRDVREILKQRLMIKL